MTTAEVEREVEVVTSSGFTGAAGHVLAPLAFSRSTRLRANDPGWAARLGPVAAGQPGTGLFQNSSDGRTAKAELEWRRLHGDQVSGRVGPLGGSVYDEEGLATNPSDMRVATGQNILNHNDYKKKMSLKTFQVTHRVSFPY